MIILGINDGFEAGAAIIKDGKILSAINEERISRIKLHQGHMHGWPYESVRKVLEIANITPDDIDVVAVTSIIDPPLPARFAGYFGWNNPHKKRVSIGAGAGFFKRRAYNYFADRKSNSLAGITSKIVMRPIYKRFLAKLGITGKKIVFVDHHLCHSSAAYYTSGLKKALVVTLDGHGDGLAGSIRTYDNGKLAETVSLIPSKNSVGWFYSQITHVLGFRMHRHEGKITGLAAYGDPTKHYDQFKDLITVDTKNLQTGNNLGHKYDGIIKLNKITKGMKREDVAAVAQRRFEEVITQLISAAVDRTGIHDVAMAGGCFANVKLNQRILELPNVKSIFIHPHMGDGGICAGAALAYYGEHASKPTSYKLDNVYFGTGFSNEEIEQQLKKDKMKYHYVKDVEKYIAEQLMAKKIVGRFNGRMEYGPRALGNRSILADPTDKSINDWLNKRLNRTEFMPFAPSCLVDDAAKYFTNYEQGEYPAQFMTVTFDCEDAAKECPAVVHVDNTARPQVVSEYQNPSYYKTLKEWKKLSGLGMFVNTSFNMHEEPILHTPYDAVRAFKHGAVDILAIGNYIVEQ